MFIAPADQDLNRSMATQRRLPDVVGGPLSVQFADIFRDIPCLPARPNPVWLEKLCSFRALSADRRYPRDQLAANPSKFPCYRAHTPETGASVTPCTAIPLSKLLSLKEK